MPKKKSRKQIAELLLGIGEFSSLIEETTKIEESPKKQKGNPASTIELDNGEIVKMKKWRKNTK